MESRAAKRFNPSAARPAGAGTLDAIPPDQRGKVFEAVVPTNWTSLASKTAIKVVPQNGMGH